MVWLRRRKRRPKSPRRSYGNTSTPSILVSPHSKKISYCWFGYHKLEGPTRTLRSGTSLCGHLLPLLTRRGRSYSLVGMFTNAKLFSSMSFPMVKRTQTILNGIRSLRTIKSSKLHHLCHQPHHIH